MTDTHDHHDERIDALGRRAGAELRAGVADPDLGPVLRRASRRRAVHRGLAAGAVGAVLVGAVLLAGARERPSDPDGATAASTTSVAEAVVVSTAAPTPTVPPTGVARAALPDRLDFEPPLGRGGTTYRSMFTAEMAIGVTECADVAPALIDPDRGDEVATVSFQPERDELISVEALVFAAEQDAERFMTEVGAPEFTRCHEALYGRSLEGQINGPSAVEPVGEATVLDDGTVESTLTVTVGADPTFSVTRFRRVGTAVSVVETWGATPATLEAAGDLAARLLADALAA